MQQWCRLGISKASLAEKQESDRKSQFWLEGILAIGTIADIFIQVGIRWKPLVAQAVAQACHSLSLAYQENYPNMSLLWHKASCGLNSLCHGGGYVSLD